MISRRPTINLSSDSSDTTHHSSAKSHSRGRSVAAVFALLALVLAGSFVSACESTQPDRAEVINSVNASRAAAGLPALVENVSLDMKADSWAQRMRDVCEISHSNLRDGAPANWRKLGENVGRGGTIAVVHDAYMNSPGHKANILDPAFNQMGAAAVWGECNGALTVFTVHVFMKG